MAVSKGLPVDVLVYGTLQSARVLHLHPTAPFGDTCPFAACKPKAATVAATRGSIRVRDPGFPGRERGDPDAGVSEGLRGYLEGPPEGIDGRSRTRAVETTRLHA